MIPFPTLAPTVDHVVHTVVNDEGTMGARQLAWGGVKRHPGNVVSALRLEWWGIFGEGREGQFPNENMLVHKEYHKGAGGNK